MINQKTLRKITLGCSVAAIAMSGISFNMVTVKDSLDLKLENPIYSNYSDALVSDNSKYGLVPFYVFVKDKLFDSYHKL